MEESSRHQTTRLSSLIHRKFFEFLIRLISLEIRSDTRFMTNESYFANSKLKYSLGLIETRCGATCCTIDRHTDHSKFGSCSDLIPDLAASRLGIRLNLRLLSISLESLNNS